MIKNPHGSVGMEDHPHTQPIPIPMGSPGIDRPQCVKSTTKFRDGPSHDLGARALAPAMQRATAATAGYASSAGKAGLASSQREREAAAAARFSSVDRRLDRRRRGSSAAAAPPR